MSEENPLDQQYIQTEESPFTETVEETPIEPEVVEHLPSPYEMDDTADSAIDSMGEELKDWLRGLQAELDALPEEDRVEVAPLLSEAEMRAQAIQEKLERSLQRESIEGTSYDALTDAVSAFLADKLFLADRVEGHTSTDVYGRAFYNAESGDGQPIQIRVVEAKSGKFFDRTQEIIFVAECDGKTVGIQASTLENESRADAQSSLTRYITHHIATVEQGRGISTLLTRAADHYYGELQKQRVEPLVWEVENRNAMDFAWMIEHKDEKGFTDEDIEKKRAEQARWMHIYGEDGSFGFSQDNELYHSKKYYEQKDPQDFPRPDPDYPSGAGTFVLSRDETNGQYNVTESGERKSDISMSPDEVRNLVSSLQSSVSEEYKTKAKGGGSGGRVVY